MISDTAQTFFYLDVHEPQIPWYSVCDCVYTFSMCVCVCVCVQPVCVNVGGDATGHMLYGGLQLNVFYLEISQALS